MVGWEVVVRNKAGAVLDRSGAPLRNRASAVAYWKAFSDDMLSPSAATISISEIGQAAETRDVEEAQSHLYLGLDF